jgi:hypothetical protein
MINRKIKIIIFGTIIFIILLLAAFFVLKGRNQASVQEKIDNSNKTLESEASATPNRVSLATSTNATSTNIVKAEVGSPEIIESPELTKANQAKFFTELKNSHPEYSADQLEFFSAAAAQKDMSGCRDRSDKDSCISAVAFIAGINGVCGEINDKEDQLECSNNVLDERAGPEIAKCQSYSTNDLKSQCFIIIFSVYKQPADCAGLKVEATKKVCESVTAYQVALEKQDHGLCNSISQEALKAYCSKMVVDKVQKVVESLIDKNKDSDGDGLSDFDELNKYFTDPNKADTDGDDYTDSAEIGAGYNPCGDGKLLNNNLLSELCSKFKK